MYLRFSRETGWMGTLFIERESLEISLVGEFVKVRIF